MLFRGTACSSHGSDASRPPARIARGHGSPCSRCPPEPPLTRAGNPHSQPARETITHDHRVWWTRPGSNRRPPGCKPGALPAELRAQNCAPMPRWEVDSSLSPCSRMAPTRLSARGDWTSWMQTRRSHLSYGPNYGHPNTLVKGARASLKTG